MKSFTTILLATAALIATTVADTFPWERLNKNDSVLLIVDIRTGLYGLAATSTQPPTTTPCWLTPRWGICSTFR